MSTRHYRDTTISATYCLETNEISHQLYSMNVNRVEVYTHPPVNNVVAMRNRINIDQSGRLTYSFNSVIQRVLCHHSQSRRRLNPPPLKYLASDSVK